MKNTLSFGQRIAGIWRALVEHLNELSAQDADSPSDDPAPNPEDSRQ